MTTMTESIWETGTYDLLIQQDPEGRPGDLVVCVFAMPSDPDDDAADEDAPILADYDVPLESYKGPLDPYLLAVRSIGEKGLIRPEDVEKVFGERLAVHILLALYEAAENDFYGRDIDGQPWREPQEEGAFPLMKRVHPLLMDLERRLY